MATPVAGTVTTTTVIGLKEDLADIIAKVDPIDTPVYSGCAKVRAGATLHEWQKWIPAPLVATASQDLSGVWALLAAFAVDDLITHNGVVYQCIQTIASGLATQEPGVGATWPDFWTTSISELTPLYRGEGEEPDRLAPVATVRLSNPTSIFWRDYTISGTLQAVDVAGRPDELAWQRVTNGMLVRRDIEQACLMNYAKQVADPRIMAGLPAWAGGEDGTTVSAATAAHTPAALETAMGILYAAGVTGDTVLMSPVNHATFAATAFTAAAKSIEASMTERMGLGMWSGAVSIYLTDSGPVQIVQDRYIDTTGGYSFVFDKDHIRIAEVPGRIFYDSVLGKSGDAHQRMCLWEGTLEVTAPDAVEILV